MLTQKVIRRQSRWHDLVQIVAATADHTHDLLPLRGQRIVILHHLLEHMLATRCIWMRHALVKAEIVVLRGASFEANYLFTQNGQPINCVVVAR